MKMYKYFVGGIAKAIPSTVTCYHSVVCPSCMYMSCTLLQLLYGMRYHLAGILLWSQVTL